MVVEKFGTSQVLIVIDDWTKYVLITGPEILDLLAQSACKQSKEPRSFDQTKYASHTPLRMPDHEQ
jgi:hypothetical protein